MFWAYPEVALTFHSHLCDAPPAIRHLTQVNPVIVNSDVADSQSPLCSPLLHSIFGPRLQSSVLKIPRDWNRVLWNFAL